MTTYCERCQEATDDRFHATAGDLNSPLWCADCVASMPSPIVFTGERIVEALRVEGFGDAAWEMVGGGCFAAVAPVRIGSTVVGYVTVGNSSDSPSSLHAPMDTVFVTVEDAAGDYFHVGAEGFVSDASDYEYSYAECASVRDMMRRALDAADAVKARYSAQHRGEGE